MNYSPRDFSQRRIVPLRDPADAVKCRRLWAEVVLTAIEDAIRYGDFSERICGQHVSGSIKWFDSRDARLACGYAGVDPMSAKKAAERWRQSFLDSGLSWPKFRKDHFYRLFHRDQK